jgi:hypothetical protein
MIAWITRSSPTARSSGCARAARSGSLGNADIHRSARR